MISQCRAGHLSPARRSRSRWGHHRRGSHAISPRIARACRRPPNRCSCATSPVHTLEASFESKAFTSSCVSHTKSKSREWLLLLGCSALRWTTSTRFAIEQWRPLPPAVMGQKQPCELINVRHFDLILPCARLELMICETFAGIFPIGS